METTIICRYKNKTWWRSMRYIGALLATFTLLLISRNTFAQPGTIDNNFNFGPDYGIEGAIYSIAKQADGKIIIGGAFNKNIARLNTDGTPDTTFIPGTGANEAILSVSIQANGKIIIGGLFTSYNGTARSNIARLNTDGSLDTSFDPGAGLVLVNSTSFVNTVAIQTNGKIIIGGFFSSYNDTTRNNIARLNSNGSLDHTFDPVNGPSGAVITSAIQTDGKILIGGSFDSYNGTTRRKIARVNTDGSLDTGFDPGLGLEADDFSPFLYSITIQTDEKIIIGGHFNTYNGTSRNHIARLDTLGTLDTSFDPGTGANGSASFVGIFSTALQADGKIIIGGNFDTINSTPKHDVGRLNTDGSLDTSFDPGTGVNGDNLGILSVAIQADGKIIFGGDFTSFNGILRRGIARLNINGSFDFSYDPGPGIYLGAFNAVTKTAMQPDGKIMVVGEFEFFNGQIRKSILRLNSGGTLDTSFAPLTGANGRIWSIARQSDGKFIIGGLFNTYDGTARTNIARINSDGSLDTSFNPGAGANSTVKALTIQSDGKIIIGGDFSFYDGTPIQRIARLNTDGSLDTSFDPGAGLGDSTSVVNTVAIQPNGKIIIGGFFLTYNDTTRNSIARLNSNGSLDTNFDPGTGANLAVNSIALQSDGKIIIGGDFTLYDGTARNGLARLNADGSLDTSLDPGTGANNSIQSIALQTDGKIIIGGNFTSYNSTAINRIASINSNGSLDNGFNPGTGANNLIYSVAIQTDGKIIIGGLFTIYNGTGKNYLARINGDIVEGPQISTSAISPASYCAGDSVSVPFTVTAAFNSGNTFNAQLSDGNGSFTSPVTIGTLSGTTSDTINAIIPVSAATGTGYRIRIVGSDPAVTGSDNGSDITINSLPAATITPASSTTFCSGDSVVLNANTGAGLTYQWKRDDTDINGATSSSYTAMVAGSYVVVVSNGDCSATSSPVVVIVNSATANASSNSPVLTDGTIQLNSSGGVSYSWTGPNSFSSSDQNPVITNATSAASGTYTVTVTAANGCTASANTNVVVNTIAGYDAGVTVLVSPAADGCYSNLQQVVVSIRNHGSVKLTSVPVSVEVSGAVSANLSATFSGNLVAGKTANFIVGTVNMSTSGTYTFNARTELLGDNNLANNALAAQNIVVQAPQALPLAEVTFTGYDGSNLSTAFPGWDEATGSSLPVLQNSSWTLSNSISSQATAKFNFVTKTKNDWILGPKFLVEPGTLLYFDAAVTTAAGNAAAVMRPGDVVKVMLSNDCGKTYKSVLAISSKQKLTNSLTPFTVNLQSYVGQQVIIGFLASEGTKNNTTGSSYDFHLDNLFAGTTPPARIAAPNNVRVAAESMTVKVWPNPFNQDITMQLNTTEKGKVDLTLFDGIGRIVYSVTENVNAGESNIPLNLETNLVSGIYYLLVRKNDEVQRLKLIKE